MKTCLLISGHLRTFKECLPTQRRLLIDTLGCDVFMHTWNQIESKTSSWHNSHMKNRYVTDYDLELIGDTLGSPHIEVGEQRDYGLNFDLHEISTIKNKDAGDLLLNSYGGFFGLKYY